ncbi:hypothetical protein BigBertha_126 [Bacillus phage BigBertha]|uniref:DUF7448 domain-containing protein n=1 Tax=Bacillus phage BigBertha TaxID=1406781 RepID=U5PRY6_9CAUD|nr:hypothetical protein BigBertha_126 [Bacillus phage BigBertha]AGY46634.1 hypothetical protein BigBertha_126 [Bacillus phage BigBertha]
MRYYSWNNEEVEMEELKGKTFTRIDKNGSDQLVFYDTDGEVYLMFHNQDCCETVDIEDIEGDLEDLLHSPILMAEEVTNQGNTRWGSQTWTFYKFSTIKGTVVLRWLGESNGYYSESVDFLKLLGEDKKRFVKPAEPKKLEKDSKEVYFMVDGVPIAKVQSISAEASYSNLKSLN